MLMLRLVNLCQIKIFSNIDVSTLHQYHCVNTVLSLHYIIYIIVLTLCYLCII